MKKNKKLKRAKVLLCGVALLLSAFLFASCDVFFIFGDSGSNSSVSDSSVGAGGESDSLETSLDDSTFDSSFTDLVTDELSIHFLEVGNKYTGDCTLIKSGDTEILIDAGSRQGSAATIVPYIQQYCTDGVLEYVIATHAHQDHIAGFVGTKAAPGIFESF